MRTWCYSFTGRIFSRRKAKSAKRSAHRRNSKLPSKGTGPWTASPLFSWGNSRVSKKPPAEAGSPAKRSRPPLKRAAIARSSEIKADSPIEYAPVQGRPRIYGPPAIGPLARAKKGVPARLANIGEVLRVYKKSKVLEAVFGKQTNQDIWK